MTASLPQPGQRTPSGPRCWRTSAKHLASSNRAERLTRSMAAMMAEAPRTNPSATPALAFRPDRLSAPRARPDSTTLKDDKSHSGIVALFDALNVIYKEREKRTLFRLYGTTFLFTLGALGFAVAATTAVVAIPVVLTFVGLSSLSDWLLTLARWPV